MLLNEIMQFNSIYTTCTCLFLFWVSQMCQKIPLLLLFVVFCGKNSKVILVINHFLSETKINHSCGMTKRKNSKNFSLHRANGLFKLLKLTWFNFSVSKSPYQVQSRVQSPNKRHLQTKVTFCMFGHLQKQAK